MFRKFTNGCVDPFGCQTVDSCRSMIRMVLVGARTVSSKGNDSEINDELLWGPQRVCKVFEFA